MDVVWEDYVCARSLGGGDDGDVAVVIECFRCRPEHEEWCLWSRS